MPKTFGTLILTVLAISLFLRNGSNFDPSGGQVPGDFAVYLKALHSAQNGVNPYQLSDPSPFKYAPGALSLLNLLPRETAQAWFAFKFFCVLAWTLSLLIGLPLQTWRHVALLVIGVALSWKGVIEALDYGQIEFVLLLGVVLAAKFFRGSKLLSGFILGFLPWIKLPWSFMVIPFLLGSSGKKRIRFLSGYFLASLFFGCLLPLLSWGTGHTLLWTQAWIHLLKNQPPELYASDINQNFWQSVWRLGWLYGSLASIFLFYLFIKILKTSKKENLSLVSLTPWLILNALVNPLGWRWSSLCFVGAPFGAQKTLAKRVAGVAVLLLFLLQQNPVIKLLGFHHWTELHHYGSVTLYWLSLLVLCV